MRILAPPCDAIFLWGRISHGCDREQNLDLLNAKRVGSACLWIAGLFSNTPTQVLSCSLLHFAINWVVGARQTPEKDEYSRTRQQMSAHIDVCMGGRVAEEIIFGADQVRPPTLGCHSDYSSLLLMAACNLVALKAQTGGLVQICLGGIAWGTVLKPRRPGRTVTGASLRTR